MLVFRLEMEVNCHLGDFIKQILSKYNEYLLTICDGLFRFNNEYSLYLLEIYKHSISEINIGSSYLARILSRSLREFQIFVSINSPRLPPGTSFNDAIEIEVYWTFPFLWINCGNRCLSTFSIQSLIDRTWPGKILVGTIVNWNKNSPAIAHLTYCNTLVFDLIIEYQMTRLSEIHNKIMKLLHCSCILHLRKTRLAQAF